MELWFSFQEETKANVSSLVPLLFCFLNPSWPAVPRQTFGFGAQKPSRGPNEQVSIQEGAPWLLGSTHTLGKGLLFGADLSFLNSTGHI